MTGTPILKSLSSSGIEPKEGMKVVFNNEVYIISMLFELWPKLCDLTGDKKTEKYAILEHCQAIVIEYDDIQLSSCYPILHWQIPLQTSDWQQVLDEGLKPVEFEKDLNPQP